MILKILYAVASFFDGNLLVLETNSAGKWILKLWGFLKFCSGNKIMLQRDK